MPEPASTASGPVRWLRAFEHRFVYVPSRTLEATPEDYGLPYRRAFLTTEDGVRLAAWELNHSPDAPWLIYFHGNAGNVSRYLPLTARLHALGFNLLMPEYRGYGESEGVPSEQGLYRDALAAYHHLCRQGIDPGRIVLYGYSLGSGVAVDLASRVEVGALVAEAAYTSIPAVARALYRIVPEGWLHNRFTSIEKIAKVRSPVLFIHARGDLTVPFTQALELYQAANEPKSFIEIQGGHVAMLKDQPPSEALTAIETFVNTALER